MERDHLNKLSITFQQKDQSKIWWQMAKWFLKNHGTVAGKYNKHKQDGSHLGFPIRMILATVDLQVISILPMNFESIALSVQEKKFKTDFQDGHYSRNLGFPITTISEEAKNRFSRWLPWWPS